jgi:predicted ferric reductase
VVVCSISDSLGRFNSVIIVQTMVVIVGFGIWHNVGTNEHLLYVFAALWGFANGAILGLWSPLVGECVHTPCP